MSIPQDLRYLSQHPRPQACKLMDVSDGQFPFSGIGVIPDALPGTGQLILIAGKQKAWKAGKGILGHLCLHTFKSLGYMIVCLRPFDHEDLTSKGDNSLPARLARDLYDNGELNDGQLGFISARAAIGETAGHLALAAALDGRKLVVRLPRFDPFVDLEPKVRCLQRYLRMAEISGEHIFVCEMSFPADEALAFARFKLKEELEDRGTCRLVETTGLTRDEAWKFVEFIFAACNLTAWLRVTQDEYLTKVIPEWEDLSILPGLINQTCHKAFRKAKADGRDEVTIDDFEHLPKAGQQ